MTELRKRMIELYATGSALLRSAQFNTPLRRTPVLLTTISRRSLRMRPSLAVYSAIELLRSLIHSGAASHPRRALFQMLSGAAAPALMIAVLLPTALQAMRPLHQDARSPRTAPERKLINATAIDSILRPVVIDQMADRRVAGAAVVVVSGDQIVYKAGFGRREVFREDPVQVDRTIWRLGSITKVLTGVAIMQLVDRGLLRLDADVNEYLVEAKVPETFPQPVTAHHLLTHTAGFDQLGLDRHVRSREEVRPLGVFLAENLVRLRPPGELAVYDTYGITLAGHLVERLSGLDYEEYLRRNIFVPLAMGRSAISVPASRAPDVAVGYEFAGHWEAMRWEYMNTAPASSANATAPDMGNFLIMLLNGGRFRGRQVLSESAVRQMLKRQFSNHPEQPGYGYTFFEDRSTGIPAFSHGGSMTGYGALLFLIPEHRIGVFVAYNQESSALGSAVVKALVSSLFPGLAAAPGPRAAFPPNNDIERFRGVYANAIHNHRNPDLGWRRRPFDVKLNESGQIVVQNQPATRIDELVFQRSDGVLVTFRQNARKEITHMFVNQDVFERIR
jgi:CubicO group peptidase (beta-lactamase class C family)